MAAVGGGLSTYGACSEFLRLSALRPRRPPTDTLALHSGKDPWRLRSRNLGRAYSTATAP